MKNNLLWVMLLAAVLATGCASKKHKAAVVKPTVVKPARTESVAIVTPDTSLVAKVVSVNTIGRFVVLNFPSGQLPKLQSSVFLYRAGLKVAEIKITGPQDGNNTVGDVISGEANAGDNVRDQ